MPRNWGFAFPNAWEALGGEVGGNFSRTDFDIDDSRTTSASLSGSGLKGIIKWNPGPEILARGVEEAGQRLLNNLNDISDEIMKSMRASARMKAESLYQYPSSPDIASANLTTAKQSSAKQFQVFLYHGPRTIKRGHYYGRNLEREANQFGGYDHPTAVIEEQITTWGREFMRRCDGALVRGSAGNAGLSRRLSRLGMVA
jgi:hypothetical protein